MVSGHLSILSTSITRSISNINFQHSSEPAVAAGGDISMMKNLLINLPEDVFITNILLSNVLPVKSLLSLRCVCRYLWNLITSPAFINMQISKELNNNNPLVLIKATQRPNVFFSLKFNGGDPCRPDEVIEFVSPIDQCSNIWGSCNGLVCLNKGKNGKDTVCLWNPFTKEYKVLPPPLPLTEMILTEFGTVTKVSYGFGYDRLLDDYKIIRCSEQLVLRLDDDDGRYKYIPNTEFQVYTLGTNTWRKISTDDNPYKSYFVLSSIPSSVVFVNGALHWIMSTSYWLNGPKTLEKVEAKIVSFDIENEVFREIQRPSMAKFKSEACFSPEIQVLRGCLCAMELDSNTQTVCNVWMMMDYGVKGSWTKLFTIVLEDVFDSRMSPASYKLLRYCGNGNEILMGSYNKILVYHPMINNKARCVKFGEEIGKRMYQSEIYIESLVSLNSGIYKDERRIRSKRRSRRSKKKRVSKLVNLD